MNKKIVSVLIGVSLVVTGCTSTGGLAIGGGRCDTGMTTAAGALVGAAIGASIGDSRYAAKGALLGGALFAAGCIMMNAKTEQKRTAADVEKQYKAKNGNLPSKTMVQKYNTVLIPGETITADNNVVVKSGMVVIEGQSEPLQSVKETLVLRDAKGKMLKTFTKDVTQSGSYASGEFENTFTWKFPNNVSKGNYIVETNLEVNGNSVASSSKKLTLV